MSLVIALCNDVSIDRSQCRSACIHAGTRVRCCLGHVLHAGGFNIRCNSHFYLSSLICAGLYITVQYCNTKPDVKRISVTVQNRRMVIVDHE